MVAIIKYRMISFFNARLEVVLEVTRYVFLWLEIFSGKKAISLTQQLWPQN